MKQFSRDKKNYYITNNLKEGDYFGEICAITNLKRTNTVVSCGPMLLGKLKISKFREFMAKNKNFERKIKKRVLRYKD